MKKFLTFLLLFVSVLAFSQNNGINFQGVGRNSSGAVLATQKISLRFTVIQGSETGSVEYVESKEVTTNAQGIFSVVIGDGTQISKTGNFTDINWKINPKFLKVEMDPAGGASFAAMGITRLQSVPFAHYANGVNADNVDGVLSASKGGTGVASISALKTAIGVDQINNTSDLAKPISTATQAALDLKVDKVNGKQLSTNDYTSAEKNKLEAISGTNTGDQDLSGLATISQLSSKANTVDLALKAPLESPTFTGTVSGITKAMVGLSNVENTADLAKPISSATQAALDTKVSSTTFSTTVATKENSVNKSTATDLGAGATSDILFPTQKAVKTYVDGLVNSGGVQNGGILTRHLADLAVTNAKVATGIDKAKVGLSNVDNTADIDKPISTETQTALDNKLDISTAEAAFARVDQSNLFRRDQAIEGGLTANRINFPSLYNSYIEGFPIPLSDIDGLNINNDYFVSVGKTLVDDTKGWLFDIRNNKLLLPNGTQIQSGTNSSTIIQTRADTDFSIKTSTVDFENFEYGESDPREHELKFTADGKLRFSDGSRIFPYISDQEAELKDIFSIRSKTGGYIELKTTSEEEDYYWTFKDDGKITFPDRATTMGVTSNPGFSIFELISPNSISIFGGNRFDENGKFGSLSIYPTREDPESEDKYVIELVTSTDEVGYPNVWKYDSEGILTFPGGATIGKIASEGPDPEIEYQAFGLTSPNGIILRGGDPMSEETTGIASIGISQQGSQGKISIATQEILNDSNIWEFDSKGLLTFPDGTTLAGNYSGSTYFELTGGDNDGFKIINGDDPANPQTWTFSLDGNMIFPGGDYIENDTYRFGITTENKRFQVGISDSPNMSAFYWTFGVDGKLEFPDGSKFGAPEGEGTTGFIASDNTSFLIETNSTSNNSTTFNEWNFNKDGALVFPDGTITSGTISGTVNFGFDTRASENGFSILTGTSTGTTQLWTFDTNGVLNLPAGGDIKIGGNSLLAGGFIYKEYDIWGRGVSGATAGTQTVGDDNSTIWDEDEERLKITLNPLPRPLSHINVYIEGRRISRNYYSLSSNVLSIEILPLIQFSSNHQINIDYQY